MYNSPPRRRHPPLFLVEDRHSVLRSYCACIYLTSTMTTTARLALFSPPPRTIPRLSSLPLPRHAANKSRTETNFFGVPCSSYMIPISPFAITSRTTNPRSSTTKCHSNPPHFSILSASPSSLTTLLVQKPPGIGSATRPGYIRRMSSPFNNSYSLSTTLTQSKPKYPIPPAYHLFPI